MPAAVNVVYMIGYHFAKKYQRIYLKAYVILLALIAGIASLSVHANHFDVSGSICSDDAYGDSKVNARQWFTAVNCYAAGITTAISGELLLIYLFASTVILPPASHMLMWMAFWAIAGELWPVVRDVCVAVWRRRMQLGVAVIWGLALLVAKLAKEFAAAAALQGLGLIDSIATGNGTSAGGNLTAAENQAIGVS